jgi:hypothetical protein
MIIFGKFSFFSFSITIIVILMGGVLSFRILLH